MSRYIIYTREDLEAQALRFGILPFFKNAIPGFSIEEMAAPGKLFGGDKGEEGCWEWKGPVIRNMTTAYGKIYKNKAGFISRELLPDFLNYRRAAYPVTSDSMEAQILYLIKERGGATSAELRKEIFGSGGKRTSGDELIELAPSTKPSRQILETPLRRLQMGGHVVIIDFQYKRSRTGAVYGWGEAIYSTPELWFEQPFESFGISPEESFSRMISHISAKLLDADKESIISLIS